MPGYLQIPIALEDQGKTAFTCPYGTFAYRRTLFGLCSTLVTFKRFMMSIFDEFIKVIIEAYIDGFSVYEDSFDSCLKDLYKILTHYEETNLVVRWENVTLWSKKGLFWGTKSPR